MTQGRPSSLQDQLLVFALWVAVKYLVAALLLFNFGSSFLLVTWTE